GRGGRDLRAAHAARAHEREQPLLSPLTSRVRVLLPGRLAPPAATSAAHASRSGEPRGGAVRRGDRLAADTDRGPGCERGGRADGDPLRAALGRARGVAAKRLAHVGGAAGVRVRLSARGGAPASLLV